ncbi:MAG: hypothetical protein ACLTFZ_10060 [Lachnospiraceae bacterium]
MHNEERFDSRKRNPELPQDADANGAYHIALKGLMFYRKSMNMQTLTETWIIEN